jgi:hypothetical protein
MPKKTPRASNSSAKTYSPPSAEPSTPPTENEPSHGYTPPPPPESPHSKLAGMEISVPLPPPSATADNPSYRKSTKPSPKPRAIPLNDEDEEEPLAAKIKDAPTHPDLGFGTPECFLWCFENLSRHDFLSLYAERRQEMREKCRGNHDTAEALAYLKPSTKPLP